MGPPVTLVVAQAERRDFRLSLATAGGGHVRVPGQTAFVFPGPGATRS